MQVSRVEPDLSTRRPRTCALALILALALAACAGPSPTRSDRTANSGYAGFTSCRDATTITADAALYRDEPRYGSPIELIDRVRAWATTKAGFEELWLDRDYHGWVTVGFHGADVDLIALQEQAAQEFADEGVVVVEVPYSLAELKALMNRVMPALGAVDAAPTGAVVPDVPRGRLSLSGVPVSSEAEQALRQFAGEPLCVDAVDPAEFVPAGDQPTEGEGWRLLGHAQGAGEAYRTAVATTDEQLVALWQQSGLDGEVPDVDWQAEIVVWFGAVYGSSCAVRLDGVVVDETTLHGEIVVPGSGPYSACTSDANPHSFVVAVERALLPVGPFVVQLNDTDPAAGAPQERTVVDVDLSAPRSTATTDQLHLDPARGPQAGLPIDDGYDRMPDPGARYVWHSRVQCSGVVIGPIDGTLWRLADGEPEWTAADGQEVALFPVDDGQEIVVFAQGTDYGFVRAPETTCGT